MIFQLNNFLDLIHVTLEWMQKYIFFCLIYAFQRYVMVFFLKMINRNS